MIKMDHDKGRATNDGGGLAAVRIALSTNLQFLSSERKFQKATINIHTTRLRLTRR